MQKVYEDLQRFNKETLVASKFPKGSMGINAWNTFVLRVEHLYMCIVRNPWIWVSPPSIPRKLHVDDCSSKPKYMFSFSATNY